MPLCKIRPFFLFCFLLAGSAFAQGDFDDVIIEATDLGGGIHMLKGAGGNLGVCVGKDGIFLIDDQYAPLSDRIKAAVSELSDGPIKFVFNTHWHGDHTGGNENLKTSGPRAACWSPTPTCGAGCRPNSSPNFSTAPPPRPPTAPCRWSPLPTRSASSIR